MSLSLPAPDPGCSLRSRKREDTRRALTEAAYALVRDRGVEGVTAEAVADRAGVSRRTFFNYFPSVESVLTASLQEFFASVAAALAARPADEDVLDSALAVVTRAGDGTLAERIAVLVTAGEASPHARALILVELQGWMDELEQWLRGRLPSGSSELLVSTYASTLCAAVEASLRVWGRAVAAAGPRDVVPSVHDHLTTVLALLRGGLDPGRTAAAAAPPGGGPATGVATS